MTERWLSIVDFPDYEVSDLGRVRRVVNRGTRGKAGMILQLHAQRNKPYLNVGLVRDKRRHPFAVHRLVMDAFVGPPPAGFDRSHIDGDPTHNALSNLTFEAHVANNSRKSGHGTAQRGEKGTAAKLTPEQIAFARASDLPIRKIASRLGCHHSTVSRIRSGRTWAEYPHAPDGAAHAAVYAPQPNGDDDGPVAV